jgi:hypothetical protein
MESGWRRLMGNVARKEEMRNTCFDLVVKSKGKG